MELMHIAKVAVDHAAFYFDELFSYEIPGKMLASLSPGCRVMVPFGQGRSLRQGMVFSVDLPDEKEMSMKMKQISLMVDESPILSDELLQLSLWMKEHTFCSYYDAIKCMIPPALQMLYTQRYVSGSKSQDEIKAYFSEKQKGATKEDLQKDLGLSGQKILQMVQSGELDVEEDIRQKATDDKILMIRLLQGADKLQLTKKQMQLVDLLSDIGTTSVKDACYQGGVTRSVADALVKKQAAEYYVDRKDKSPYVFYQGETEPLPALSNIQQSAFTGIKECILSTEPKGVLLHGVTGSGKTNVYMHAIQEVIRNGKKAIVLVPEISLTPQLVSGFFAKFGDRVGVIHSGLSMGERLDQYRKIKHGEVNIVVGTRSAIFAPLDNIGLIVLDEEQESSYHADSSPRYHARDIAKFRCGYHHATLLMCSATPSIESYYYAKIGNYLLLNLPERYNGTILPKVYIADMKDELKNGNTTGISTELINHLTSTFQQGKQAILLLNRRGYHNFVSCMDCGEVIKCPSCSIAMTYHAVNHSLMCHYCGHVQKADSHCPVCGSDKIRYQGYGTQKLEEELKNLFPQQSIVRMDADTTSRKYAHQEILDAFGAGKYDILLGTQMIAKGLDFDNVQLVGVLNADQTLFSDDFRSYEKTFSLLTQVIGRSGRRAAEGEAVIQTISPDHETIQLAATQDYLSFYNQEIILRKMMMFPPFCSICIVGISGLESEGVEEAAKEMMSALCDGFKKEGNTPVQVMGPVPYAIFKMNNRYRMKITIKCRNTRTFRDILRQSVVQYMKKTGSRPKGLRIVIDMNPETI